jgi:hypothetical protein
MRTDARAREECVSRIACTVRVEQNYICYVFTWMLYKVVIVCAAQSGGGGVSLAARCFGFYFICRAASRCIAETVHQFYSPH